MTATNEPTAGNTAPAAGRRSGGRPARTRTSDSGAERVSRREPATPPLTVVLPTTPPTLTPGAAAILLRILRNLTDQHDDESHSTDAPDPYPADDPTSDAN